jgi:hypothetical protein
VTIPPVVAIAVPIATPIPRGVSENVFLPVTAQTIVAIPEIVRQVVSVPEIVRVPQIISIPELRSDSSLVPNAGGSWISAIRD